MLSFEITNYFFPVRIFCFDYKKGKTGKPNTWTDHTDKICTISQAARRPPRTPEKKIQYNKFMQGTYPDKKRMPRPRLGGTKMKTRRDSADHREASGLLSAWAGALTRASLSHWGHCYTISTYRPGPHASVLELGFFFWFIYFWHEQNSPCSFPLHIAIPFSATPSPSELGLSEDSFCEDKKIKLPSHGHTDQVMYRGSAKCYLKNERKCGPRSNNLEMVRAQL